MEDSKKQSYPCRECQVGTLQSRPVSYFTVQDGQLVSVPDFPALVCDVCGSTEYDSTALAELHAMLEATRHSLRPRRRLRPKGDAEPPRPTADPRRRP
ncbi:MAG: YgiT-type zinc finger protein [Chloroflexi bacterium]|jgi:YgiT-type zinc finger domain-containing protein|nr:YgiT-type zinc finger protein [Chloroflexota bacterium]